MRAVEKIKQCMEDLHVADAITEIFNLFKRCNKYIDETTPWTLAKDPEKKDRLATVLYNLSEGILTGTALLKPFMPETAEKIAAQFSTGLPDFDGLKGFGCVAASGAKVTEKPEILFARLDEKEIMEKVEVIRENQRREATLEAGVPEEEKEEEAVSRITHKEEILYDDFSKLEFRVGEILACEAVKKSKKLLKSQVKIGNEIRQIVSGIHACYEPEEMVGKKVMVVVNLKPATLAGELSEGMILFAEDAEGRYVAMVPEKDVPSGSEIA